MLSKSQKSVSITRNTEKKSVPQGAKRQVAGQNSNFDGKIETVLSTRNKRRKRKRGLIKKSIFSILYNIFPA